MLIYIQHAISVSLTSDLIGEITSLFLCNSWRTATKYRPVKCTLQEERENVEQSEETVGICQDTAGSKLNMKQDSIMRS